MHFDKKHKTKPKVVKIGDKVLIEQKNTTICRTFDPKPFTVTEVKNNAFSMSREDGTSRVRDKNQSESAQNIITFSKINIFQRNSDRKCI